MRRQTEFQTIRSEGGLLPADLLQRILDTKEPLPGTNPEDYGLPRGERINEVITQSWNRLRKHWVEFRAATAALPATDPATGATNDKWSLPLLRELGFGPLPTAAGPEIGGRSYAISRFVGPVPVHLVGCGVDLDRRAAGVRGAAAINPHGLVQEFVNRSPAHLWAIVSNGLRLRVLRDNHALSRQSFLEFDIEAMFAGEVYSDFVLLWLTTHATRFAPRDGGGPETCWLEEWTKEADKRGARVLGDLRVGVERALQILGEGFSSHPGNTQLRDALRSGQLQLADFHGQLLRVVYRLIFLCVAEDRILEGQSLLHPRDDAPDARAARERYATFYSAGRLRELAGKIKGSRHPDLWRQFQIVVGALWGDESTAATRSTLALPALGSLLWKPSSTAALNDAQLTNYDFLEALRHLAFTRPDRVLRPVNYRNLGAEELGGIYESLLALTPQISADGARFGFAEFAGNERKTSGSYYTPDALVQNLLDSALEPVIEEATRGKTGADVEQAILGLKVCDPAVGSGHFLVGAAHRLGRHLARARAMAQGESEPSPLLYQQALRDVIGRCLYGVDLNPMAAELCRVSLWLEALEPGKPLSFLDHHIRVGNSLLGATPEMIAGGIPDQAFTALEGDDKKACAALKKRNKAERAGLGPLFAREEAELQAILAEAAMALDMLPDDLPERVRAKELALRRHELTEEYRRKKQLADAWCAAFLIEKRFQEPGRVASARGITQRQLSDVAAGNPIPIDLAAESEQLSVKYKIFHWHLAFPEVFARGGFDCVLGNPPWEMMELSEKEYFAQIAPEISHAQSARLRQSLIKDLAHLNPRAFEAFGAAKRANSSFRTFVQGSGAFPTSSTGRINLYPLFVEHALRLLGPTGRGGLVIPSAISMDAYNAPLFMALVRSKRLASFFDFENADGIFPGVHRSYRFCLMTFSGSGRKVETIDFCYFAHSIADLSKDDRRTSLTADEIAIFSPNTLAPPMLLNARDTALARLAYGRFGVLKDDRSEPGHRWSASVQRMLSLSDPGDLFRMADELGEEAEGDDWTRLYCGKAIHQYDHRYATWTESQWITFGAARHADPSTFIQTEYYVRSEEVQARLADKKTRQWLLSYRDVCRATDERTVIASIVPPVGCDTTCRNIYLGRPLADYALFAANINSFPFDYFARQKVIGIHLGAGIFEQLPVVPPDVYDEPCKWVGGTSVPAKDWLLPRVVELTFTAWDLQAFALDCGWQGPPFRWDAERRFLLRCEVDAAFFHLYFPAERNGNWRLGEESSVEARQKLAASFAAPRAAVEYILDAFPIVKRKDEEKHGDYRTKLQILDVYDRMQTAMATNVPYQTLIDPPPADPRGAHDEGTLPPPSGSAV